MTKGEAREQFLRYLGVATVNGAARSDADLKDGFDYLLWPAVLQAAAQFPTMKTAYVCGEWNVPEDFFELVAAVGEDQSPVSWRRTGERSYRFEEPCTAEYTVLPSAILPQAPDETEIPLDDRTAMLVPVRAAIDAAVSSEEYAFRVPYLTAAYNGLLSVLGEQNAPSRRRVYAV